MKHIEVVAAIIINDNKVLCVQRNINKYDYISLKFEFPGGKIEEGESREAALVREIEEELKKEISIQDFFLTVYHEYPDFTITMHSFICTCKDEKITLTEHVDYRWLSVKELQELDWAAADVPIVEKLLNN